MEKLATISVNQLNCLQRIAEGSSDEDEYFVEQALKAAAEASDAANSVHVKSISWKLFNISSYGLQVLVSKGYEDGEQFPYTLRLQTNRDGYGSVVDEIGFDDRQEREEAFYSTDEDKALEFLKSKMFLHPIS